MVNPLVNHMANGEVNMATKNKKSKKSPPSRLRYEAANPTVSVRISQEIKSKDELKGSVDNEIDHLISLEAKIKEPFALRLSKHVESRKGTFWSKVTHKTPQEPE